MAKNKLCIRQLLVATSLLLACSQAALAQAEEPPKTDIRSEWGWGAEAANPKPEEAPVKKTVQIPYFEQDIGQHLLAKDFKFLVDAQNIRESYMRAVNVYGAPFGRYTLFGYSNKDFYDSVYAYLSSATWEEDLKKLPAGDAAFIRIIVYYCFIENIKKRYIQIQLEKVTDESQRKLLKDLFQVRDEKDSLTQSHWLMIFGLGANFFSNGANDKISPGPNFDIGFSYCLLGKYCADLRIGSIFIVDPYKEDVVQSGITYPKEDISYTAVEAQLRAKLFLSFDYDLSVYGGLRLHCLEFDTQQSKTYKEKYGKDMKNGYSYGYTVGISGTKYYIGNGASPKLLGLSARFGVATFGENSLDIGGYNWYGGLDLLMRLGGY